MEVIDWIEGDLLGLQFPCHPEALRDAGAEFLTKAFHATGALPADNAVVCINRFDNCPRGSTGRKVLLSVEYAKPSPDLHTNLFVKFSRAFDDPLRDNQRFEMELEARFAAVSREPNFPVELPMCYFSEFHNRTGTGILITQCIPYGEGAIERHYEKSIDWEMPDQIGHYRALIGSNARLAGTHRAGRLPQSIARKFPFDAAKAIAADPIPYDATKLRNRVSRFVDFCERFPQLLPENVRRPEFHARLMAEVPLFLEHERAVKRWLHARKKYIVFCHWNANVDNAWFWRDDDGALHCGLIDWGRVGQMTVASALWGSLSGAEISIWDHRLDELLELFCSEFLKAGGDELDPVELRLQLHMQVAMLGLCWLLDAIPLILREIPDLATAKDRFDDRFRKIELARTQLHLLSIFMNLWERHDLGRSLRVVLDRIA